MTNLIKKYIDKLTIDDIRKYSLKNDISLNQQELNFIYNTIKNDYNKLLSDNYTEILDKLKKNLSKDNYDKIVFLFHKYKKEYGYLL